MAARLETHGIGSNNICGTRLGCDNKLGTWAQLDIIAPNKHYKDKHKHDNISRPKARHNHLSNHNQHDHHLEIRNILIS